MKSIISLIVIIILAVYAATSTGCATSSSQPQVQAQASENGGSWTHQNTGQYVDLSGVSSGGLSIPQQDKDTGNPISLGESDINPDQAQQAASDGGRPFVYIRSLTISQSVRGGADAKRGGEVSQSPGNGNTDQTSDNKPDIDGKLDVGGIGL